MQPPNQTPSSPITAERCAGGVVAFQDVVLDGDTVYWTEMRPQEAGRNVIVKSSQGHAEDVLPEPFNARSRVHELGGASFIVIDGCIYFTNDKDQRVYRFKAGETPVALTTPGIRFADFQSSPYGLIAIAESHLKAGEPENYLALIDITDGSIKKLTSGFNFYAACSVSPNGRQVAFICWNHPNMPWDDTQLWVADLSQDGLRNLQQQDSGFVQQSFYQPQWSPQGELYVISDKSNWWNLYQVKDKTLHCLFAVESEIGKPLWVLGGSQWGFYQEGIICALAQHGKTQLYYYHQGGLQPLPIPYSSFSQIRIHKNTIACIAGSPQKPTAIIAVVNGQMQALRTSTVLDIDSAYLSEPQHITFASFDRKAHAYFYPPTNPDLHARELPPLIVRSHGGPTGNCGCDLNLEIQFWTSRGYAYVDVNYAGSTGYGRAYRKSLEGKWGIYDVQDCIAAAQYLVAQGKVSPDKLIISGGSAGGYTTLCALAFADVFKAGTSLFGVSDLEALAKDTHKFESRYLDKLIGPYPEERQIYLDRSPLYHTEKLSAPVIFFQGDEDKIVPRDQTEKMYAALKAKGIKTELFIFAGEQHGFRKAETKIMVLKEQERFFNEVFKGQ